VASGSNVATVGRLREATDTYLSRLQRDKDSSFAQIEEAKKQIADAEASGNLQLAEQYKTLLSGYEAQAKAIDTEYIDALSTQLSAESDYQKTQAAITQSGITTFQGLTEAGTQMDYETISSYAEQLNLPTDMLMGYYEGAQIIRDDKTLDQAAKEIGIAQLNQDFEDQVNGLRTKEAQNIDYLKQLYAEGADQETISAFKSAAGITDINDPALQADLKYTAAQTAYLESQTTSNYVDVLTSQAEYNEIYGSSSYVPTSSVYEVTQTADGISINVYDGQPLDDPNTKRDEGQCGAFVNDVTGTSMGNTLADKMKFTDDSILAPEAGMFFVQPGGYDLPEGDSGHTGMIQSVDLENQKMIVIDANKNNDGRISIREVDITPDMAFGRPPNGYAVETGASDDPYTNYYNEFIAKGYSADDAREKADEKVEDDMFNEKTVLGQVDQNDIAISNIDAILETVETFGFESGLIGKLSSLIPQTDAFDVAKKLETVKAIIGFQQLQEMRNASKTGGALGQVSEMENKLLQSVLGSLDQGQSPDEFIKSLNSVKQSLQNINNAAYEDYGIGEGQDETSYEWRSAADTNVNTGVDDI